MIDDRWRREFDQLLYDRRHGVQFCDLDDDDQKHITELAETGMTPEEAFDVLTEVEDVE